MAVELTLLDNVKSLGNIGDVVKVADGYARNYLMPRGLAIKATPGLLRQIEARKHKLQEEYEKEIVDCKELSETLSNASITIPMQAGDNEKLYGSVSEQQIVYALSEMNFDIERKQVILSEPIRKLGVFSVDIDLHREVTAFIKVWCLINNSNLIMFILSLR